VDQTRAAHELAAHGAPAALVPALIVAGRALQLVAGIALVGIANITLLGRGGPAPGSRPRDIMCPTQTLAPHADPSLERRHSAHEPLGVPTAPARL